MLEQALAVRSSTARELIFLSVGDTRDHRRQHKDPALRTISIDFILNLLANLRRLGLEHFFILTTQPLCHQLQKRHCLYACGWTSLWHTHPGLPAWNMRPGDMFLMWAQQSHYIARAMMLGYSVLRMDTDVYFAEDPYPILHGPLLRPFSMVVQQDFGGPLGSRPACARILRHRHSRASLDATLDATHATRNAATPPPIASCGVHRGTALLNIGLVYVRAPAPGGGGGGALAVINGTWSRFLDQLSRRPHQTGALSAQPQHVESLIDQPLMRAVVSELSVPERASDAPTDSPHVRGLNKPRHQWTVVPGSGEEVYAGAGHGLSAACALGAPRACARVAAERARTPFLAQLVAPRTGRAERIALAPDWFFGRGCLVTVRSPLELLRHVSPGRPPDQTQCMLPPSGGRRVPPAPGPAAGMLVATHFVYSMALKRQRAFRAFGWDVADARNRTSYEPGEGCWRRSAKAVLFSHTFFAQTTEAKAVLCAMPGSDLPACSCCVELRSLGDAGSTRNRLEMESTSGHVMRWNHQRATKLVQGCTDYQAFWD